MVSVKNPARSSNTQLRAPWDQDGQQSRTLGLCLPHSGSEVSAQAPSTAWTMPRSTNHLNLSQLLGLPSVRKDRVFNTPP